MDDDNRTILLLKIGVGTVVLIILIIVAIIIFNVIGKGGSSGNYETTTRRTLSEVTEKEDDDEDQTKKTKKTSSSTTKNTSTSTTMSTVITQAPVTQAQSSGGGTSSSGSGSGSSSGGSSGGGGYVYTPPVTQAPVIPVVPDYTQIRRGNATGYSFALDNYEWDFTDKINATKYHKTASELRTLAERIASACCEDRGSCSYIAEEMAGDYGYVYAGYNSSGLHIMNRDGSLGNRDFLNDVYSKFTKNFNLAGSPYEWVGVGFIQSSTTNSLMCYAVVLS